MAKKGSLHSPMAGTTVGKGTVPKVAENTNIPGSAPKKGGMGKIHSPLNK